MGRHSSQQVGIDCQTLSTVRVHDIHVPVCFLGTLSHTPRVPCRLLLASVRGRLLPMTKVFVQELGMPLHTFRALLISYPRVRRVITNYLCS